MDARRRRRRRLQFAAAGATLIAGPPTALMTIALIVAGWSMAAADCGNGTPTANVSAPAGDVQTEGEAVRYLESQGIPANASAGIVGNLEQESTLNPAEPGGELAQWGGGWYSSMTAWVTSHGQSADSIGGELEYIAANVQQGVDSQYFYPGLKSQLDSATSPQQAALVWMDDYEQCSGAGPRGSTSFTLGSLCEAQNRETYAAQALQAAGGAATSGSNVFVSTQASAACNASYPLTGSIGGYTNPLSRTTGLVWERTDQGVDARMNPGSPLLAFAPSKVEMIVPDFYAGEPAIVLQVSSGPLAGKWWYLSEQIQPTVSQGQTVNAGQVIATYAPAGTGIEIGWWTPNGGSPLGHPGYVEGDATTAGADFRFLLGQLGADPGTGVGMSAGTTLGTQIYPQ